MATAPVPGAGKRAQVSKAAQQIAHIKVGDKTHKLAINNIPIKERLVVRKATGLPFENFMAGENSIGMDTLQIWYWLARRGEGEAFLTLEKAMEDWPEDPNEFELWMETPDEDNPDQDMNDPESSGPDS